MSDLFENHIVGFSTRRLICVSGYVCHYRKIVKLTIAKQSVCQWHIYRIFATNRRLSIDTPSILIKLLFLFTNLSMSLYCTVHYENLPMQYTGILFFTCKNENFIGKKLIFFIFLLKT